MATKKNSRTDVTYPSPDPSQERICPEYKVGGWVTVKPNVFYQGLNLGGKRGYIKNVDSYLEVRISMDMPSINEDGIRVIAYDTATFNLLRYEVEDWNPPLDSLG